MYVFMTMFESKTAILYISNQYKNKIPSHHQINRISLPAIIEARMFKPSQSVERTDCFYLSHLELLLRWCPTLLCTCLKIFQTKNVCVFYSNLTLKEKLYMVGNFVQVQESEKFGICFI